jgi:tetratricopeptide (TPR) repeat protein
VAGRELAEVGFEDVRALAYHSLKGNVAEKTIVYALEAGMRSLALNALADAEQFLSDGLALVRLEPGARWKTYLLEYLRCLADTYRTASKHAAAKELLAEAIPLAEELGRDVLLGRMLTSLAKSHQVLTEYADALSHAGRSVEVCEAAGDLAGLARALMTVGRVHFFQGSLADAVTYTERAITAGRASGDTTILGFAYGMGGYFYVASGQPDKLDEGVRFLNESLALLEATGDRMGLINSLVFLGNAQVMLGDYPDAWTSFLRVRTITFETGSKDDEIVALVNLATTALELGDCHEAILRAKEARELVDKRGSSKYAKGLAVVA